MKFKTLTPKNLVKPNVGKTTSFQDYPSPSRLSLQKCRKIVGPECSLSDSELESFRDSLYALADVAYEAFQDKKIRGALSSKSLINVSEKPSLHTVEPLIFQQELEKLISDERETLEERVAIMEYEGNLSRPESENLAFKEYLATKSKEVNHAKITEN